MTKQLDSQVSEATENLFFQGFISLTAWLSTSATKKKSLIFILLPVRRVLCGSPSVMEISMTDRRFSHQNWGSHANSDGQVPPIPKELFGNTLVLAFAIYSILGNSKISHTVRENVNYRICMMGKLCMKSISGLYIPAVNLEPEIWWIKSCFHHLQSKSVSPLILCEEAQVLREGRWHTVGTMGLRSNIGHEVILMIFLRQKHKVRKQSKAHSQSDGKRLWKVERKSSLRPNIMVIKA